MTRSFFIAARYKIFRTYIDTLRKLLYNKIKPYRSNSNYNKTQA